MAAILLKMETYDPSLIQGSIITKAALKELTEALSPLSTEEMLGIPGLQPQRRDIIRQGAAILSGVMDALHISEVRVSDCDNLEGYLLSMI